MAKTRNFITDAWTGLAGLSAAVLKKRLHKDDALRVSEDWDNETLSEAQIKYAALDAWTSLEIYRTLAQVPVAGDLPPQPPAGYQVSVLQDDKTTIIAHGYVTPCQESTNVAGCNVTPTRLLITITNILIPGALLSLHQNRALDSFGPEPFQIVCARRLLQSRPDPDSTSTLPSSSEPSQPNLATGETEHDVPTLNVNSNPTSGMETPPVPLDTGSEEVIGGGLAGAADEPVNSNEMPINGAAVDPEGLASLSSILTEMSTDPSWKRVFSRVLKDVWHLMDMVSVPAKHGLRPAYARALRDAILIPDKEDRERLSAYLLTVDSSWEKKLKQQPKWLWKRCRRVIPPPDKLVPLVAEVYRTYGPLRDAKTGQPLFNAAAWESARNVLKTIAQGYVSDPPGVGLYFAYGKDKRGLTLYRCARGTNATEGGIHRPIRRLMPTSGASPRHARAVLLDFTLSHNLKVLDSSNCTEYMFADY